jgi:hypothetical protein
MTRGATDNDTTAHLEHGEPADLPASRTAPVASDDTGARRFDMREDIPVGAVSGFPISPDSSAWAASPNPRRLADKGSARFGRIKGGKP